MIIDEGAKKIISILNANGYKAYAVGGCVRDALMGKPSCDIDIATNALPEKTAQIMTAENIKIAETGLKHGTVTAVLNHKPYEITTFRKDGDYTDCRHPESVFFVSNIQEDLSRRDFTINAMAYNEEEGIIDLFGGKEDLKNGVIRAVGDANTRFNEDALRIMRALRFASVLGFKLEEKTKKAVFDNKMLLKNIANERIFTELLKLLCGDNALSVLDEYREIIAVIIPELEPAMNCGQNTPWHIYNVYEHIIHAVDAAPKNPVIRLTMLLHDIGKPSVKTTDKNGKDHFRTHAQAGEKIAYEVLKRFKASNEIIQTVTQMVKYHQSVENVDDIRVKRWLARLGAEKTRMLFDVRIADLEAHNPAKIAYEINKLTELKKELEQVVESGEAYRISDLAVNGNDLIKIGLQGREIGETLNEILSLVIDGNLENSKEAILSYIINKYNN